jgi:type II secretion system protein H
MKRAAAGFTVIEVMIVVAIMAVLAGVVVPSFQDQIGRRRVEGAANALNMDLQYAKSLAVTLNTQVTLATGTGGTYYSITYTSGGTTVTQKTITMPSGVSITANTNVVFDPMRGMTTSASNVNMTLSSTSTTSTLTVTTSPQGVITLCGSFVGYLSCS